MTTIPAIIKKKDEIAEKFKYFLQKLNFVIQVQAATKVPSATTKT